jgi:hypothetical protein
MRPLSLFQPDMRKNLVMFDFVDEIRQAVAL